MRARKYYLYTIFTLLLISAALLIVVILERLPFYYDKSMQGNIGIVLILISISAFISLKQARTS
jgi:hypothetical protein